MLPRIYLEIVYFCQLAEIFEIVLSIILLLSKRSSGEYYKRNTGKHAHYQELAGALTQAQRSKQDE
jgi:hypothetical protein